jgi:pimeloyl-ACP methyl ester carboxylesterase
MTTHTLLLPLALLALVGCSTPRLQPREGHVAVPGGQVWFKIVGSGPGTPLLPLHGGPGAPSHCLDRLGQLGDERPVIFYDQLGCGRSDRPSDTNLWRVERFVEELAAVRRSLGLKRVHLFGHSWGTMLATDYLLTRPRAVRSMTLASPCLSAPRFVGDASELRAQLPGPVPTYYDHEAKTRAERLQADLREMNGFYQEKLGVQVAVHLAVLNSNQWTRVNPIPFGLPGVLGEPPVVFMPAHSGGWAFRKMLARKEAIAADVLQEYLRTSQKTFEAASDDFVDFIALHELGHALLVHYGIDPSCNWLNEFLASYFGYAFLAERRPERKPVIALFGRPSQARPKHTTLADFERLYFLVDDYAWYQGMFEQRIQEMYPQAGLQFIKDLKRQFPRTAGIPEGVSIPDPVVNRIPPEVVIEKLEVIAPGFQAWARDFQE